MNSLNLFNFMYKIPQYLSNFTFVSKNSLITLRKNIFIYYFKLLPNI